MKELQSTIECLMLDLDKEGRVRHLDERETYAQFKEINRKMEEYEKEKQQRAADSADDLARVILTA